MNKDTTPTISEADLRLLKRFIKLVRRIENKWISGSDGYYGSPTYVEAVELILEADEAISASKEQQK